MKESEITSPKVDSNEEEVALINQKIAELIEKHKVVNVYAYVAVDASGKKIVGFIKEPSYIQKVMALDKMSTVGMFMAANELREALTLKEDSDPETYIEAPECDKYRLGMTSVCMGIVEVANNSFKKK